MANIFDQFDAPVESTAPVGAQPANPFDQFDAPPAPAPLAKDAVDWSKYNQPLGELKPYDPSPTQMTKDVGQDVLIKAGMQPYTARQLSEGLVGVGSLTPMGSVLSAADLPYDLARGNYGHTAMDALGVIPGVVAGKRLVQGIPKMPMADVPKVNAQGVDELKSAANTAYDAVRNSPVVYHPQMLDDMVQEMRVELTRRGLNIAKAPSTFGVLDAASAPRPRNAIVTPDDLDTFRQQLRGGVPGTQDNLAGQVGTAILDRRMASPAPQHVISGTGRDISALGTDLATARGNYRSYKTADTVEGKIDTSAIKADIANSGANLDNTTRQHLASLLTTKAGQRAIIGATDAEKAAIEQAARGDWLANTLRYGGKYLGGGGGLGQFIASSTGGGIGTTAAHMLGADPLTAGGIGAVSSGATMLAGVGLREAANARTTKAAGEVADMIRRNSPEYAARVARTPDIADPMAMRRDAIAYSLIPQLRQAGTNVWDQLRVPYENREQP